MSCTLQPELLHPLHRLRPANKCDWREKEEPWIRKPRKDLSSRPTCCVTWQALPFPGPLSLYLQVARTSWCLRPIQPLCTHCQNHSPLWTGSSTHVAGRGHDHCRGLQQTPASWPLPALSACPGSQDSAVGLLDAEQSLPGSVQPMCPREPQGSSPASAAPSWLCRNPGHTDGLCCRAGCECPG